MKKQFGLLLLLIIFGSSSNFLFGQRGSGSEGSIPSVTIHPTITYATCFNQLGSVDYYIEVSNGWIKGTKINRLDLYDDSWTLVESLTGNGCCATISNLSVGMYTFYGSMTVQTSIGTYVSVPLNFSIWVGIETVWAEKIDMIAFPNSYSAKRNVATVDYGGVRSSNRITSGNGWIEMSAVYGTINESRVFLMIGETDSLGSFDPNNNIQFIEFFKGSSGNGIRIKSEDVGGNFLYTTLSNNYNDKIRLVRSGSTLTIQKNNSNTTVFTLPVSYVGSMNIAVRTLAEEDGCLNVVSSFECLATPCSIIVTSNTGNGSAPIDYSLCDVPQMTVSGAQYYSWSPQVGLSCYDCASPELLLSSISNGSIPNTYVVEAYNSLSDKELGLFCTHAAIPMSKIACPEGCQFNVQVEPNDLSSLCVGDVITFNVIGGGNYVWNNIPGFNCIDCSNPFFTVQNETSNIILSVLDGDNQPCGGYEIEITPSDDCMNVDGVSYNNYGVCTYVFKGSSPNETNLTIYGSILNEPVVSQATGGIINGLFINESGINVSKDWTNNALNDFFETSLSFGNEELFGSYQRIKGVSPTEFHNLLLSGAGKKELFVDAYALNTLDLTINELSTRDNVFFVENLSISAVSRISGFVSSNLQGGGFSRKMNAGLNYLYPLGSSLGNVRYRPIEIVPENSNKVTSRLVNYNPSYDNLINLAIDVASVNNRFYHEIAPETVMSHAIKFHYNSISDGNYQHIGQYDMLSTPTRWQKTGSISLSPSISTPNNFIVETNWDNFNGEQYVLASAGFVIDLGDLGNTDVSPGGNSGVTVTVTSTGNSSGGGLGNPTTTGNGNQGVGTYTPSPVGGVYIMSLNGDCIEDAEIKFEVDNAGNIIPVGPNSIYFQNSSGVSAPLSEALYSLLSTSTSSPNTGVFDINSTPIPVFAECTDDVKIQLTNGLKLNLGDDFVVSTPNTLTVSVITITDIDGVIVATNTGTNIWNANSLYYSMTISAASGLYHYNITIDDNGTSHLLKGQFIIE